MARFRKVLTRFDDYRSMLSDRVRMDAYRRAIASVVQPGDTVVDLGAGLGILSMLAVRAGASKVWAIEQGDAAGLARRLIEHNGLSDRIELIEDNSKQVTLPQPADVLLSETLGSFAVDENTLDFTLDARQRLLKPGGAMIPLGLQLFLAPVELPEAHASVDFWREVEGFDFSPAIDELQSRMSLSTIAPRALLARALSYADVDLGCHDAAALQGKLLFELERKGTLHGLGGWFRATLCEGVAISTAPDDAPTHWQQAFFPFRTPIEVVRGDYLEVTLAIGPKAEHSDDTVVSYDYRCTQLAAEASTPPKVGRNDACPCGSGKKHKRCCG